MAVKMGAASKMQKSAVSKMDAVRRALTALGKDAMPVDIQGYVKKNFGLVMTTAHVSNYKTDILRKLAGKSSHPAMKPVAKKMVLKKPIVKPVAKMAKAMMMKKPSVASINGKAAAVSLKDVATIKVLVKRVGERNLKSLVDLLGK